MSIQEQIKEVVTTHRVVLFMKGTKQFPQCGFSARAVQILQNAGCNDFVTVNVLENDEVRQGIKEYSNWPTIPQLYVNGEFLGGSDIMMEMFEAGELEEALKAKKPFDFSSNGFFVAPETLFRLGAGCFSRRVTRTRQPPRYASSKSRNTFGSLMNVISPSAGKW